MKFLAVKLAAIKSELEVSTEIHASASREVDKMFKEKYFPEIPVEGKESAEKDVAHKNENQEEQHYTSQQPQEPNAPDQASAEKLASPEVKKIFKKIASKIHPDKLEELDNGYEKEQKRKLFEMARKALEENDILGLSDVAMQIDVEVPEMTELTLKKTEEKIISLKKQLHGIESTIVWHWFFCEDPSVKQKMLEQLFELMYAHNTRS
jgi:uncharacterized protein with von Willebrand factor type A (vWA) domain